MRNNSLHFLESGSDSDFKGVWRAKSFLLRIPPLIALHNGKGPGGQTCIEVYLIMGT